MSGRLMGSAATGRDRGMKGDHGAERIHWDNRGPARVLTRPWSRVHSRRVHRIRPGEELDAARRESRSAFEPSTALRARSRALPILRCRSLPP